MKSDITRTLVYVAVALLCLGLAWVTYPQPKPFEPKEIIGVKLFDDFTHPDDAAEITITQFNTERRELEQIRIAAKKSKQGRQWTIAAGGQEHPYRANDVSRRTEALSELIGLKVVDVIDDSDRSAGDFVQYGVVVPSESPDDRDGVGTRVTINGESGELLFDLVIGNEVDGRPEDEGTQRYVRKPDEDRVLVVRLDDVSNLTTRFQDWVGEPLLGIGQQDKVQRILMNDYTFSVERGEIRPGLVVQGVVQQHRNRIQLHLDDATKKWIADDIASEVVFGQGIKPAPVKEKEELNTQNIKQLCDTLSELRAVGVEQKPDDIRKFVDEATAQVNQTALPSDVRWKEIGGGIRLLHGPGGTMLTLGSEGGLRFSTDEGIRYFILFGDVAGQGEGGSKDDAAPSAAAKEKTGQERPGDAKQAKKTEKPDPMKEGGEKKNGKEKVDGNKDDQEKSDDGDDETATLNRYIFVRASVDPAAIPREELEKVPPVKKKDPKKTDPKKTDPKKAKPKKGQPAPKDKKSDAGKSKTGAVKKNSKKPAKKTPAKKTTAKKTTKAAAKKDAMMKSAKKKNAATDKKAKPPAKKDEAGAKKDEAGAKKHEAGAKKDEASAEKDKSTAEDKAAAANPPAESERDRVLRQNAEKKKDFQDKLAAARKKVLQLNKRFARWYYIISEDDFKKIHVARKDVVRNKSERPKPPPRRRPGGFPGIPGLPPLGPPPGR